MHRVNQNTEILVVDDTVENIKLLTHLLKSEGYRVKGAASGSAALRICNRKCPDLILLDIMMPNIDGYEVSARLKSDPNTSEIPIIFLSALDNVQDKVRAFQVGAVDYIQKPFEPMEVLARVNTHTKIVALQRRLMEKNSELKQQAELDHLTGLYNRRKIVELAQSREGEGAVILFDIDDFKTINDRQGHDAGDKLLIELAGVTQQVVSEHGEVFRWGGEEFLVLLKDCTLDQAEQMAQLILDSFHISPIITVTASIGVASLPADMSIDEAVRQADKAMYQAKTNGKDQIAVY